MVSNCELENDVSPHESVSVVSSLICPIFLLFVCEYVVLYCLLSSQYLCLLFLHSVQMESSRTDRVIYVISLSSYFLDVEVLCLCF